MAVRRQEDVLREFINAYQRNPCLWKVKSKEYTDRNKKEEAYELLVEVLRQINPDANADVVRKKINSMRSCFRKEYRKVEDSKRTGSEDIYVPSLWYFELLMFLKDQEMPGNSVETDDTDCMNRLAHESENDSDSCDVKADLRSLSTPDMPPRKRTKIDSEGDILHVVGETLQNSQPEDEFDIVGRNVAEKLRKLEPNMKIFAEKLINDTFFEAQLGTLNRYAHITVPCYSCRCVQNMRNNR